MGESNWREAEGGGGTVRLFADDTIICMTIFNGTDATALQQDLDKLAKWEET